MAEWRFSRRQGVCAVCEREFEDQQRHVSALQVSPEGLARADFCLPCWDARDKHEPLPVKLAAEEVEVAQAAAAPLAEPAAELAGVDVADLFWWATRYEVAKRKTVQLDLESLERLFLELEGNEHEPVQELRYVLCLILMRKRRLKVERVLRLADGEAFRVKRPRRDERYEVRVFDFSPERMAEIRTQMQAIFDGADGPDGLTLPDAPECEEEFVEVEDLDGAEAEAQEPADQSEAAANEV